MKRSDDDNKYELDNDKIIQMDFFSLFLIVSQEVSRCIEFLKMILKKKFLFVFMVIFGMTVGERRQKTRGKKKVEQSFSK